MDVLEFQRLNKYPNDVTFRQTCRIQQLSLRESFINYIIKSFKSLKVYQKLILSCKLFFLKDPILVIPSLVYKIPLCIVGSSFSSLSSWVDINKIKYKIWLTASLHIPYDPPSNIASSLIIPKIFRCDINELFLCYQIITIDELRFMTSSAVYCRLMDTQVKNSNGSNVLFFSILQEFRHFKELALCDKSFFSDIANVDMEEVFKLSSKLDRLHLSRVPEAFDIESLYHCLKSFKNRTSILLGFDQNDTSDFHGERINAIADEILATTSFDYVPPTLASDHLGIEKQSLLRALVKSIQIEPN